MAEPTMTLGLRFRRHVAGWVMDTVPTPPPGELETLCARADAAERGMVADAALMVARAARDEDPELDNWLTLDLAAEERREARAAWRAINGGVDDA